MSTLSKKQPLNARELAALIGLASLWMLFGTLIFALVLVRYRASVWPPLGANPIAPLWPSLATMSLLFSAVYLHFANRKNEYSYWRVASILALAFIALQFISFTFLLTNGYQIDSNLLSSFYFGLSGLHFLFTLVAVSGFFLIPPLCRNAKLPVDAPRLFSWFWFLLCTVHIIFYVLMVVW